MGGRSIATAGRQATLPRTGGSPIRRTDGKGYRAPWYDLLGRRRWSSGPTAEAATLRQEEEVSRQAATGRDDVTMATTVADILELWLKRVTPGSRTKRSRRGLKRSTWVRYDGMVRNHLSRFLVHVPALTLTTEQVDQMLEELKGERYLGNRSIEYAWQTLVAGYRWGVEKRYLPEECLLQVKHATPPAVDRRRRVPAFSMSRTNALLAAIAGHRLGSLFSIAARVGPRQGELLAAAWEDVDWDAGHLLIHSTLTWQDGRPVRERNKTDRARLVPLGEAALSELREWRHRQSEERARRIAAGFAWPNDAGGENYIWTSPKGNPVRGTGSGGATHQLKNALRRANEASLKRGDDVPIFMDWRDWNFYALRHHAATWLLAANNGNLYEVMKILGHSSYGEIERTYGHLISEVTVATMAAAAAMLDSDPAVGISARARREVLAKPSSGYCRRASSRRDGRCCSDMTPSSSKEWSLHRSQDGSVRQPPSPRRNWDSDRRGTGTGGGDVDTIRRYRQLHSDVAKVEPKYPGRR